MKKIKNKVFIAICVILCAVIIFFFIFAIPNIEGRTWVLSSVQQAEAPFFVVAHNKDYDFSNDESMLFQFSKPIELICKAKDGKLILTDKTNSQTYEGTYSANSSGRFGIYKRGSYTVVIDGVEGTANISSDLNRTLFVSIGGYYLNFMVE